MVRKLKKTKVNAKTRVKKFLYKLAYTAGYMRGRYGKKGK